MNKSGDVMIAVWASIADDGPWTSILGEDVPRDESEHLLMVVCPSGDSLKSLGHIIHITKIYSFLYEDGKGPMKSIPHRSNISVSRIGLSGISYCLELLNAAWHFKHSM